MFKKIFVRGREIPTRCSDCSFLRHEIGLHGVSVYHCLCDGHKAVTEDDLISDCCISSLEAIIKQFSK